MQFPVVKRINSKLIGDDLIGMKPGESFSDVKQRFLMEQRLQKIEKIRKKMNERYI